MGQVSTAEKLREILFCPNCIKRHVIASYSENCISLVPSILTSQSTSLLSLYYGGELVMQQYNFRCGYKIHSLLVSHAISSSLRKKNPIDEKDLAYHTAILHIIVVLICLILNNILQETENNSLYTSSDNTNVSLSARVSNPYRESSLLILLQTMLIFVTKQGVLLDLSEEIWQI